MSVGEGQLEKERYFSGLEGLRAIFCVEIIIYLRTIPTRSAAGG
jgi:hypothetical protein